MKISNLLLVTIIAAAMATANAQNTFPSSGNVGIGTSTPQALLEVQASDATTYTTPGLIPAPRIRIVNSNTTTNNGSALTFSCFDAAGNISTGSAITGIFTSHATGAVSGDLAFQTRNAGVVSEVARFTANGRVGIGITTPGSVLSVLGASNSSTAHASFGSTQWRMKINSGDEINSGTIDYRGFDPNALGIVGAGTGANRLIRMWEYVGINSAPSTNQALNVSGSGATYAAIFQNGKVGIGTTTPVKTLHVVGSDAGSHTAQFTNTTDYGVVLGSVTGGTYGSIQAIGTSGAADLALQAALGGKVGIGTTTPAEQLHVWGGTGANGVIKISSNNGFTNNFLKVVDGVGKGLQIQRGDQTPIMAFDNTNLRVGIGTTTPSYPLHVVKDENTGSGTGILVENPNTGSNAAAFVKLRNGNGLSSEGTLAVSAAGQPPYGAITGANNLTLYTTNAAGIALMADVAGGSIRFATGGNTERMRVNNDGNVGIGTTAPSTKLEVVGTVYSTSGGFKFPDGSVQTTAFTGSAPTLAQVLTSGRSVDATGTIQASDATTSLNLNTRTGVDLNGTTSIKWGSGNGGRKLHDEVGNVSLDWSQARSLLDANHFDALLWGTRVLIDATGTTSVDWNGRALLNSTGNTMINWETKNIPVSFTTVTQSPNDNSNKIATTAYVDAMATDVGSSAWDLQGNGGTDPTTDFVGTTDAQDLVFRTDGLEQMRITSTGHVPATDHPGNVGIGTNNPEKKLHVVTKHTTCSTCNPQTHEGIRLEEQTTYTDLNTTEYSVWDLQPIGTSFGIKNPTGVPKFFIHSGGNVGIGTTGPTAKLEVAGTGKFSGDVKILTKLGIGTNNPPTSELDVTGNALVSGSLGIGTTSPQSNLDVTGNGYFSGPLAINTASLGNLSTPRYPAGYLLAVNGKVIAEEYVAKLSNQWADYVFKKDYKLRTLEQLESFVIENSHLPGIPSAAEVAEKGVSLTEMSKMQMEKIEELTLYIIQMNKNMTAMDKEIKGLKVENAELKAAINK